MKFKFYISKEETAKKLQTRKTGLKYNKNRHRLESKDIVIDLVTGHASIGGLTVGRRLGNKYVLTSHVYVYGKELIKIEKALKSLGKRIDLRLRASYGLDRIPDMITEIKYETETAKTKKTISALNKEEKVAKSVLSMVVKQDKKDFLKLQTVGVMMDQLLDNKAEKFKETLISLVQKRVVQAVADDNQNLKVEIGGEGQRFVYRVQLSPTQAIVATNQCEMIKIGFETEYFAPGLSAFADINNPEDIFGIIKGNKNVEYVSQERCIEAITLILDLLNRKQRRSCPSVKRKIFCIGTSEGRLQKIKE